MWDLLGTVIHGLFEFVGDLLEKENEAAALPEPDVPPEIAGGAEPIATPASSETNYTAAMDGGSNSDRFDPRPPDGPYSP